MVLITQQMSSSELFQTFSSLQSQNKEFGRVYEKSIRRLESLEVEHKRACDEIERLRRDLQVK